MKLYLVRHGQSEGNEGGIGDKLTEIGIEQAKRLGLFLKDKHIDYIYCSKLGRAKETLDYVNKFFQVPVEYSTELNEMYKGIYEGKLQREHEDFIREQLSLGKDIKEIKPEGGESWLDVEKRAQKLIVKLKSKHSINNHVLIVSHSGFLRMFIIRLMKLNIHEARYFRIHNASLSTFELDKNFNVLDYEIDDFKHLLKYSSYKRESVERV
ncbi:histidine phosphatase family protein [Candidatus Woesearchaeota archaeon]|nr:histidine phosphatase family protein [Candidatus Woesearchaeota archaeon]